ncbi:MAG: alpha/beta hydrolase [Propionibacteriaceae bacterium]|jgi:pimeloyl-ACP methyl ester carboxylesterase|nr:alpha/beta hydrolase [Propionibacteriaceae bacterium]
MTAPLRFADIPAGHPARKIMSGRTPTFAAQADQRFAYTCYVPPDYRDDEPALKLWVFVHGTSRRYDRYLDGFADLATRQRAIVLAPLFPAGILDPNDATNYHLVEYQGIRFDAILLSMIDEIAHRWNVAKDRFFLHGNSGGGQFAHRFLYLHPDRLNAVSIGAPGQITLPTADAPWWRGVGRLEDTFGIAFNAEAVKRVPAQIVVGSLDNNPADIASQPGSPGGEDRLSRARTLHDHLLALGGQVQLDIVPGVGHDGAGILPTVSSFLETTLQTR